MVAPVAIVEPGAGVMLFVVRVEGDPPPSELDDGAILQEKNRKKARIPVEKKIDLIIKPPHMMIL